MTIPLDILTNDNFLKGATKNHQFFLKNRDKVIDILKKNISLSQQLNEYKKLGSPALCLASYRNLLLRYLKKEYYESLENGIISRTIISVVSLFFIEGIADSFQIYKRVIEKGGLKKDPFKEEYVLYEKFLIKLRKWEEELEIHFIYSEDDGSLFTYLNDKPSEQTINKEAYSVQNKTAGQIITPIGDVKAIQHTKDSNNEYFEIELLSGEIVSYPESYLLSCFIEKESSALKNDFNEKKYICLKNVLNKKKYNIQLIMDDIIKNNIIKNMTLFIHIDTGLNDCSGEYVIYRYYKKEFHMIDSFFATEMDHIRNYIEEGISRFKSEYKDYIIKD